MNRTENLRVAFTKIFESNAARRAELRALRARRAMVENTMNYRQSLRVLFEAVIEEAAVRTPKKVRGALEKDERGIAIQDGPEELVADIKNRHPENSPIGKKARQMAYRYWQDRGEAAEKQRAKEKYYARYRNSGNNPATPDGPEDD